jgi:phosphotransferase system HPr (HPr) family protein
LRVDRKRRVGPSRQSRELAQPLEEILPEVEFLPLLEKTAAPLRRLAASLETSVPSEWPKKVYVALANETNELESFLDDHGARDNRRVSFFTELVASMRWFAMAGHALHHLETRFPGYGVALDGAERDAFLAGLRACHAFVSRSTLDLLRALEAEALALGVRAPAGRLDLAQIPETTVRRRLPRNVDEAAELVDEAQKIAEVASKYLRAADLLRSLDLRPLPDPEALRRFVERHCNEEKARVYEATLHNIQSKYDTHIKSTALEAKDDRLPALRGHVSAALHLLEIVTYLVHFYERHENDIRSESAKARIAALVDKNAVLRQVVDFALANAVRFLEGGRPYAEGVLPHYTKIRTLDTALPDGIYLHARPASLIVSIVNHYGTPVEMEIEGSRCNAGSILQVMILAGSHAEARTVRFQGDERPLRDLGRLFEARLGEGGLEALPPELDYLRGR